MFVDNTMGPLSARKSRREKKYISIRRRFSFPSTGLNRSTTANDIVTSIFTPSSAADRVLRLFSPCLLPPPRPQTVDGPRFRHVHKLSCLNAVVPTPDKRAHVPWPTTVYTKPTETAKGRQFPKDEEGGGGVVCFFDGGFVEKLARTRLSPHACRRPKKSI